MTNQRDKACKQDINRILLLDSDRLGFESFGFGILNCPSLAVMFSKGRARVNMFLYQENSVGRTIKVTIAQLVFLFCRFPFF